MGEQGTLRVLHFGLGAIGIGVAREAHASARLVSVAAVDLDPAHVGRPLASLWGADGAGVTVRGDLEAALGDAGQVDVAFHCAGSHLGDIEADLLALLSRGINVVTTAEELIWPYGRAPEAAERLDAAARAAGVTLFAAGVNPGFLMDRLPVYLSSMTLGPSYVRGRRLVDLAARRNALRRKMGVGEDAESVRARTSTFSMGHAGFPESVAYVAAALGWKIGEIRQTLEPVIAKDRIERGGEVVEPGCVLGLAHVAEAATEDGKQISLSLTMRIDCEEPFDELEMDGRPPMRMRMVGGLQGDQATLASAINAAPFVAAASPGLLCRLATPATA